MSFLKDLLASMEAGAAGTDDQSARPRKHPEPKDLPQDFVYSDLYDASGENLEQLHEELANDREARLRLYKRETYLERKRQAYERDLRLYAAEEARQVYARRAATHRNLGSPASSDFSGASESTSPSPPLPVWSSSDTLAPETSPSVLQAVFDTNQTHEGAKMSLSASTVSKRKLAVLGDDEVATVYPDKKTKQRIRGPC